MTLSSLSSETSDPSTTISSPTITAGAASKSSSKYSSVLYSAIGFDMVSNSTSYFAPSPGIISLKCFHGLPLGSLRKNLIFSMSPSFLKIVKFLKEVFSLLPFGSKIDPRVENPPGEGCVAHSPGGPEKPLLEPL
jgi:hypothetical protein